MPDYLVRLAQFHESFRKAELQALAEIAGVPLEIIKYDEDVCRSKLPGYLGISLQFWITLDQQKFVVIF